MKKQILFTVLCLLGISAALSAAETSLPNIVLIYTDDVGYGDVGCNVERPENVQIPTPNIDRLAAAGVRFTNAHATSATCTPSRFALLTGQYPWRRQGTGIARGNAGSIISPETLTLPKMLQKAGYKTAAVGKWHLGLGPAEGPDWNGVIKPGPRELGFDYNFILPATVDRVPCVYVENDRVANLDPDDPITVSYQKRIGDEPTGVLNPEMLKVKPSHGHNNAIVNGIGRIGFMTGGTSALWDDETIADTLTGKAIDFIRENKDGPFFVYFATHDVHVPRTPHPRYAGKSGHGARGDVILQLDGSVGEIMKTLDELGITENTIVIFSSDNGPVVDDGYYDGSIRNLGDHKPSGPLRGGKYSAFEAGTRIPLIVRWPTGIPEPKVSGALVSQIDFFASFAALTGQTLPEGAAPDSRDHLATLTGRSDEDREYVIEHALNGTLGYLSRQWKFIEPKGGAPTMGGPLMAEKTPIETGYSDQPQLYDLESDLGETKNAAVEHPEIVEELSELLRKARE